MGNVINFFDKIPKEYRQDAVDRGYARHRAHHHQLQIERKRKLQLAQKESERGVDPDSPRGPVDFLD